MPGTVRWSPAPAWRRTAWPGTSGSKLPSAVRDAIIAEAGPIERAELIGAGSAGDFIATLITSAGLTFCKGNRLDSDHVKQLCNELRLNRHLPADLTPRVRWQLETGGWLIAAFDHAAGRVANLRPGSPDLAAIGGTLTRMATALTPCPAVNIQPATARWGNLLDPALVDGDTLIHTDMTHNNFLVDGHRVQVVDWSMPCRGAAWLDTARMVVRLIRAGHAPAEAEAWAAQLPTWASATPNAVEAFAAALAKLSRRLRDNKASAPHLVEMAAASEAWLQHRLQDFAPPDRVSMAPTAQP